MAAAKVKEGHLVTVRNRNPHRLANLRYLLGWVEDETDGEEKPLLFTENEVKVAFDRGARKHSMVPTGSRLFNSRARLGHLSYVRNSRKAHHLEADGYYFVRMTGYGCSGAIWLAFTRHQMAQVARRTSRNPEDVLRKSFLTDLID